MGCCCCKANPVKRIRQRMDRDIKTYNRHIQVLTGATEIDISGSVTSKANMLILLNQISNGRHALERSARQVKELGDQEPIKKESLLKNIDDLKRQLDIDKDVLVRLLSSDGKSLDETLEALLIEVEDLKKLQELEAALDKHLEQLNTLKATLDELQGLETVDRFKFEMDKIENMSKQTNRILQELNMQQDTFKEFGTTISTSSLLGQFHGDMRSKTKRARSLEKKVRDFSEQLRKLLTKFNEKYIALKRLTEYFENLDNKENILKQLQDLEKIGYLKVSITKIVAQHKEQQRILKEIEEEIKDVKSLQDFKEKIQQEELHVLQGKNSEARVGSRIRSIQSLKHFDSSCLESTTDVKKRSGIDIVRTLHQQAQQKQQQELIEQVKRTAKQMKM